MLVRIHASFPQDRNIPLQFFNLIQVVNEGFGDLLDQEGTIGNIELDLGFYLVVGALKLVHLLSGAVESLFSLACETCTVRVESGGTFDSLLETILFYVALDLFLESLFLLSFLLFHNLAPHFNSGVMFGCRGGLFNLLVTTAGSS